MLTIIFAGTTVICAIGWVTAWIGAKAVVYYMAKKGYTPPSEDEIQECTRAVVEEIFKRSK